MVINIYSNIAFYKWDEFFTENGELNRIKFFNNLFFRYVEGKGFRVYLGSYQIGEIEQSEILNLRRMLNIYEESLPMFLKMYQRVDFLKTREGLIYKVEMRFKDRYVEVVK